MAASTTQTGKSFVLEEGEGRGKIELHGLPHGARIHLSGGEFYRRLKVYVGLVELFKMHFLLQLLPPLS